ncbi:MAG TPA: formimidoylglutamase [Flavobacteriaceae bacterium]|nr:formimidoylglutamase [Flavobacteriaceae bacterium]
MEPLLFYNRESILKRTSVRKHEVKIGEQIEVLESLSAIQQTPAKYILLGIAEDIGVRANHGRSGASEAWESALNVFLNLQHTQYTHTQRIALLGEIDCREENYISDQLQPEEPNYYEALGRLVQKIDEKVTAVVKEIVSHGKIPIVIGGGHNNAYGCIQGSFLAKNTAINAINFDAHTDFRPLEHRHSGNGFSFAYSKGFLNMYFIFGLQRNYTSQSIWDTMVQEGDRIQHALFEDILFDNKTSYQEALDNATDYISDTPFGIELDLDSIADIGSSAMTPSAFDLNQARLYLRQLTRQKNCTYIHLCEGAPKHGLYANQIGKTLAYLISDCIAD